MKRDVMHVELSTEIMRPFKLFALNRGYTIKRAIELAMLDTMINARVDTWVHQFSDVDKLNATIDKFNEGA
jgi:hypothetical protein